MVEVGGNGPDRQAAERMPREIWVLVGTSFLIAIGYGIVAPALPVFVRSFEVGITAASLVISVFALVRLLFAPLSGTIVGRLGEVPTFTIGLGIVALSTGACAFAATYWQLLALRGLGGIGSTMFTVSALSLLIRLAPVHMRGRASGMWATGFLLGNVIGPLVGGGLVVVSLRTPFLVYAAVLVLVVCVALLMLRGSRPGNAPDAVVEPPARFRAALAHPAYRAALAASFANGWVVFGVRVALVPLFVVEAMGRSEAWSGIALAVFAAGNAATLVIAGRWADRRGRRPPVLAGLAVTAVATAVLGFLVDPVPFLVASLLAGMGSGLVNPPINAAVADVIGSRGRGGTVLAGFQMVADLGAIVGPVAAGALAEVAGYGAAFALSGAAAVVALCFWLRAPETLPAASARATP
ncbi:MFS transporter [Pseudonocardia zijingensis]|uniref:MFS transporter n=1 Tax=Pseudonocardia zijingensis TaxID=153376 RepID=A0ABN1N6V5_9PSEU